MKLEEIVGREITGFQFKGDKSLNYSNLHVNKLDQIGIVESIYENDNSYAKVRFSNGDHEYYPTKGIIEQLEYKDRPVEIVFKEIYILLRKL